ncbi:MAG: NAD-dependent epimerase/dehydratase family protein [Sandaracinaceae bacterium]
MERELTVVTGATGQVGRRLLERLVHDGRHVRALVLEGDDALNGTAGIEVVTGDVRDRASLDRAFEGASSVFHLAAVVSTEADPGPLLHEVNVVGATHAVQAARAAGVARYVHFSSIVVFDPEPQAEPLDETRRRLSGDRLAPYTRSKLAAERAVRAEVDAGLHAVIVHPTVIVGPHETHHDGVVRGLVQALLEGNLPATVSGGFDLVGVDCVVDGALLAEAKGRAGQSYLLGGSYYEVSEVVDIIAREAGIAAPRVEVPRWVAQVSLPLVEATERWFGVPAPYNAEDLRQLGMNRYIEHTLARRELGYRPKPIQGAVRDAIRWLRDEAR